MGIKIWTRYTLAELTESPSKTMIKFFRKIRRQLLLENKTGKYLKYAIGEILLVMIGILLALQVNQWNEVRKTKSLEQSYLKNLLEEFTSNRDALLNMKKSDSVLLASGSMLLDLHQFGTFNGDTLAVIDGIEGHGFSRNFNFKRDVWNDIYSTGNAMIFRNLDLQRKMSEFYSASTSYEFLISDLNEYHKRFRDVNKGVLGAHHRVEQIKKFIENDTTTNFEYPVEFDVVFKKFASNEESSSILADQLMVTMVSTARIKEFITIYIDPISTFIEKELIKLE